MEIDDGTGASAEPTKAEPEEENASVVGSTPVSNDLIPSRGPAPAPAAPKPAETQKKLTTGVKYLLTKNKVDQIIGEANALDAHTMTVAGKNYFGKNIIIASGSVPISLPLPGFADAEKPDS
ncbi:hypothetical protein FQA39_LY12806 [Lamprigera yunnana]|nr:hypothetical protein FQA39_LY12806 [Lamprigera yunnana]